jgi:hypothetical protein
MFLKIILCKWDTLPKVIDDEIQAYLQYGYEEPKFGTGVDIDVRKEYSDIYKKAAKQFK